MKYAALSMSSSGEASEQSSAMPDPNEFEDVAPEPGWREQMRQERGESVRKKYELN